MGQMVELRPVEVTIYSLALTYVDNCCVDFEVEVSGGTYVRSLGRDIARALGTVGHLVGLERIAVGPFDKDVSIPFEAFELGGLGVLEHHLRPVDAILDHLPAVTMAVGPQAEEKVGHGMELGPRNLQEGLPKDLSEDSIVRILDSEDRFRALGRVKSSGIIPFKQWLY